MKKLLPVLLAITIALLAVSGIALADKTKPVESIELSTKKMTVLDMSDTRIAGLIPDEAEKLPVLILPVGKKQQISVTVSPKGAKNKFDSSSSDQAVFTAEKNNITGIAPGIAVLTITSDQNPEISARYNVLVIQPVKKLSINADQKSVAVGGQITLTGEISPETASIKTLVWKSENEKVAIVDQAGNVTGVKKGDARIIAASVDGTNIRANINVKVVQKPEEISLNQGSAIVAAGKNIVLKATVLPKTTNDKKVVWSSSDENIAKVDKNGRIKGISKGTCEITCASVSAPEIKTTIPVEVTQPVKAIAIEKPVVVYAGETAKLQWNVEPETANNKAIKFTSGNKKILEVDENGNIKGHAAGKTYIKAEATDGSHVTARINVTVYQHVTGIQMKRKTAYVQLGTTAATTATIEPKNATNKRIVWSSADPSVATVTGDSTKVSITGNTYGTTTIKGVTEDGGYEATLPVRVGDWESALVITDAFVEGDQMRLTVKNVSDLYITWIRAEVYVTDIDGNPVPCNIKDGSNKFTLNYKKPLEYDMKTDKKYWGSPDFMSPESPIVSQYEVRIVEFQIDNDWPKSIRKKYQPTKKCPVHI